MKVVLDWFTTLSPVIQAVAIISLFAFFLVVLLGKDAAANFVNIVPWIFCLLGSGNPSASTVTVQPKTVAENICSTVGGQEKKT